MENNIQYNRIEDLKRLEFIKNNIIQHFGEKTLKILDVGCGNGNIARFLGALNHNVLGIDISESCIMKAKALTTFKNVHFEHVAVENVKMSQHFDVVICSEVLEHLEHPEIVLSELKRLLDESGLLVITVPNGYGPREVLMTKPQQWIYKNTPFLFSGLKKIKALLGFTGKTIQSDAENLSHIQFFSKKSLINLVKNEKFNLIKAKGSNFVEGVFPLSFISKKSRKFQAFDCWLSDQLPLTFSSGFMTVWRK